MPSPLLRSSSSLAEKRIDPQSVPRPKQFMGPDSELIPPTMMKQYRNSLAGFTFPQGPEDLDKAPGPFSSLQIGNPTDSLRSAVSPRSHDFTNGTGQPNPPTKMLSPASVTDTPRSSGEMYSMSNNSTETLASEYITRENSRLLPRPAHSRRGSSLVPTKGSKSEVLMMGYAQLTGSFTLDASLVNQNPFEGVRKKGIVGGQGGGGVVRSESAKRESGFLGSLSWGNIGDSFGGIIGSNEVSSIKEGKNPANARSIPILSTPQSVLFVDLQLEPGESKSYIYRHPLPKGIPPTHKGRALKVSYSLIVGTQRAAKVTHQHQMRHADIPFRVLSSVNGKLFNSYYPIGI